MYLFCLGYKATYSSCATLRGFNFVFLRRYDLEFLRGLRASLQISSLGSAQITVLILDQDVSLGGKQQ